MKPLVHCRAWRVLLAALLLMLSSSGLRAEPAPLRLHWELERVAVDAASGQERSHAALVLSNAGKAPLGAGWWLYFSAIAGAVTGEQADGSRIEQVNGTLYRLRPGREQALAPGQSLRLQLQHEDALLLVDKAPQDPYLVFDTQPAQALAIADYRVLPPSRPEHFQLGDKRIDPVGPQALYERYAAWAEPPASAPAALLPTPLRLRPGSGELRWQGMPAISAPAALRAEVALARRLLAPRLGGGLDGALGKPGLQLALGTPAELGGLRSPEAYALNIDAREGVRIVGASAAGVARGLQSLRSLAEPIDGAPRGLRLPVLRIEDEPRFAYRGLMLDVARNFQDKQTVLALIELMARYKLNKLHLHLSDDEGWRLEIAGLPELTAVGARRGHGSDPLALLPSAHGSGPDAADPHGSGFYSRTDYIEILRHAAAHHVQVIPEIDMPAHARAAVVAMEARHRRLAAAGDPRAAQYRLRDPGDRSVYRSAQQHNDNVMDPGLESTYAFIEHVLRELARLHATAGVPLQLMHVGGDEQPAGAWSASPASQALIRARGLAGSAGLWDYFFERVATIVQRHGAALAGWEELGARRERVGTAELLRPNPRFLGRDLTLYVWNNLSGAEDLAYRLANAGYRTVLAPATHLYFDMAHLRHPEEPGHNWAAYADLDTVFALQPLDMLAASGVAGQALEPAARARIAGLQGTLFSETMRTPARIEQLLMPRMLALAERAWAAAPAWEGEADAARAAALRQRDLARFMHQLGRQELARLDRDGPALNYRIAPPGLKRVDGRVLANHQLPGFTLRYTSDGSEPHAGSRVVTGPITDKGVIKVAAFNSKGRQGRASSIENP